MAHAADSKALQHAFVQIAQVTPSYGIPITKYRSTASGLEVTFVDIDGTLQLVPCCFVFLDHHFEWQTCHTF
jgi:hypothetical protein